MLGSGVLLGLVGALIIALLPLAVRWRVALAAGWTGVAAAGLARTAGAYRRSIGYRLYADGSIDVLLPGSGRVAAVYAAGSVILPRVAWLSVRAADGYRWGELIAGNPRKNKEWRRLLVICRLVPAC